MSSGLGLDELRERIGAGDVDTVLVAFPDLQGRLMGKRVTGHYFLDHVVDGDGIEACNYLLAVDVDMTPLPGYTFANWEQGYGDIEGRPRPRDAASGPLAREDRARAVRPRRRGDGNAGRGVAPPDPPAAGRAGRRRRLLGEVRVGARVLPVPRLVRGGGGQGLRRPRAALAGHRGLPHPPDDAGRVPDPRDPQRRWTRRRSRSSSRRARRGVASTRSTSSTPTRSRWPIAT